VRPSPGLVFEISSFFVGALPCLLFLGFTQPGELGFV
jgi:hypothetical protein